MKLEIVRVFFLLMLAVSAIVIALYGLVLVPVLVVSLLASELVSIQQKKTIKMYEDALAVIEKMVKNSGGTA